MKHSSSKNTTISPRSHSTGRMPECDKRQDGGRTTINSQGSREERDRPMSSHNWSGQSLLSRRRRVRSERPLWSRRTSLTRRSSAEEISSNHNPHSKHRETDHRPFERYRSRKRGKHSPRLRYPSSLRGGGPQASLHRSRLGTRFWK